MSHQEKDFDMTNKELNELIAEQKQIQKEIWADNMEDAGKRGRLFNRLHEVDAKILGL